LIHYWKIADVPSQLSSLLLNVLSLRVHRQTFLLSSSSDIFAGRHHRSPASATCLVYPLWICLVDNNGHMYLSSPPSALIVHPTINSSHNPRVGGRMAGPRDLHRHSGGPVRQAWSGTRGSSCQRTAARRINRRQGRQRMEPWSSRNYGTPAALGPLGCCSEGTTMARSTARPGSGPRREGRPPRAHESRGAPKKFLASAIMRVCSLCEERKVPARGYGAAIGGQRRPTWLRPFCLRYLTTASSRTRSASRVTSPCTEAKRSLPHYQ
jgi:hypothetical protein